MHDYSGSWLDAMTSLKACQAAILEGEFELAEALAHEVRLHAHLVQLWCMTRKIEKKVGTT